MKFLSISFLVLTAAAFADTAPSPQTIDANLKAGAAAAQSALATPAAKAAQPSLATDLRAAYQRAEETEAAIRRTKLAQLAQTKDPAARAILIAELEARWAAAQPALTRLKAAADAADRVTSW